MLGSLLLASCTGFLSDPGGDMESPGPGPVTPPRNPTDCVMTGETAVGAADPWRLTVREYEATVTALVGRSVPDLVADLPTDPPLNGYDNQVAGLRMTVDQVNGFQAGAERVVDLVTSDAAVRRSVMGCDVTTVDRHACLVDFASRFGRLAYRRPLEGDPSLPDSEVGSLVAMAETLQAQADVEGSPLYGGFVDVAAITAAILQSPSFLTRITVGEEVAEHPDRRALTGYELATRLSYLLLGEGPDSGLLDAADAGTLDTVEGLEAEARRLIATDRAREHFENFFHQWFGLGAIFNGNLDLTRFPELNPALQEAMYEEVQRLLSDYAFGEGTDFMGVYTSSYGYANAALGRIYGVSTSGTELDRVELGPGAQRAGLLSSGALLTMTSHPTETSIVNRGLLVRETVLCGEIAPPPPNVPDIEPDPTATSAELQNRHTADPVCATCHIQIDPIGYGMEPYDAIGRLRTDRTEAEMRAMPRYIDGIEDSEFYGGIELGELVASLPDARACVVEQMFRWSMGREAEGEIEGTTCSEASLTAGFESSGHSIPELLIALITSDEFRFKSNPVCE